MLTEGTQMPRVNVLDDAGKTIGTGDLLGSPLVLWFYPKDDTPG